MRTSIRQRCREVAAKLDPDSPLNKDQMEQVARALLAEADLPERYLGWTMVMISGEYWREPLSAVPPSRRLFLLPHCLKHADGCPAKYDQFGLNCKECGACSIADYRGLAEQMGYRVLVAEGSPVVMKIIVGGYVDAVIGVACLNVLEKAIDKVLLAGVPCMAVPLLSSDCRNTKVDPAWVNEMIQTPHIPDAASRRTYVHLMRAGGDLFKPQTLIEVAPPTRITAESIGTDGVDDPIAATESIAYEFLTRGGKHSRPFITLAAYDAMTGGACTEPDGQDAAAGLPDLVRRAAVCIETFHKASLVHDDIEDDDPMRYGVPTIHRRYGTATAINVGDYLIGLGYRLLSRPQTTPAMCSGQAQLEVLDMLAAAHLRLSEGQGAELRWRDGGAEDAARRELTPLDALKIYALKTSPAFEVALLAGIRLATEIEPYREAVRTFSRNMGVAFQIINDIKDLYGDFENKGSDAGDLLGGRPTLLYALAMQNLNDSDRQTLVRCGSGLSDETPPEEIQRRIATGRRLYEQSAAVESAMRLIDKHQARAEAAADSIGSSDEDTTSHEPLRRLLYFLVDTVLERPTIPTPPVHAIATELNAPVSR